MTARTNTGGAGGFAIGIRRALELGCDAVWLMDDDTVPEPEALAALVRARHEFPLGTPAVVASRVARGAVCCLAPIGGDVSSLGLAVAPFSGKLDLLGPAEQQIHVDVPLS